MICTLMILFSDWNSKNEIETTFLKTLWNKRHLNGTKGISTVTVFRPNFLPIKENNLKQIVATKIVIKYANHEVGVRRFFKFHNLVFSRGYLEKK